MYYKIETQTYEISFIFNYRYFMGSRPTLGNVDISKGRSLETMILCTFHSSECSYETEFMDNFHAFHGKKNLVVCEHKDQSTNFMLDSHRPPR